MYLKAVFALIVYSDDPLSLSENWFKFFNPVSPSVSAANKIKLPFPKKFWFNSSQPWASHTAHQQGSGAGTLLPASPFAWWWLGMEQISPVRVGCAKQGVKAGKPQVHSYCRDYSNVALCFTAINWATLSNSGMCGVYHILPNFSL